MLLIIVISNLTYKGHIHRGHLFTIQKVKINVAYLLNGWKGNAHDFMFVTFVAHF